MVVILLLVSIISAQWKLINHFQKSFYVNIQLSMIRYFNGVSREIFLQVYQCGPQNLAPKKINIPFFTLMFSIMGYVASMFRSTKTYFVHCKAWKMCNLQRFHATDDHQDSNIQPLGTWYSLQNHLLCR